ncbi:prolipoprotein diacylglyceryl transferase, partial [Patescibacteria group bacterium]|nr:prolipoprotein diacylglyceryl transferase [Patescibacteria group bacterium]
SFLFLTDLIVPGLILAQTIGRWGNYFNTELFGLPTTLPWGIPIPALLRPLEFLSEPYFHPTFLYESLGNLFIFIILILVFRRIYLNSEI